MSIMIGLFFVVLLVLVGGGVSLIVLARRGPRYASCGNCGYDVSRSVGAVERCPECGADFIEVGIRPPRARRMRPLIALAFALFAVGLGVLGMMSFQAMVARERAAVAQAQLQLQLQRATTAAAARTQPTTTRSAAESTPEDAR